MTMPTSSNSAIAHSSCQQCPLQLMKRHRSRQSFQNCQDVSIHAAVRLQRRTYRSCNRDSFERSDVCWRWYVCRSHNCLLDLSHNRAMHSGLQNITAALLLQCVSREDWTLSFVPTDGDKLGPLQPVTHCMLVTSSGEGLVFFIVIAP